MTNKATEYSGIIGDQTAEGECRPKDVHKVDEIAQDGVGGAEMLRCRG